MWLKVTTGWVPAVWDLWHLLGGIWLGVTRLQGATDPRIGGTKRQQEGRSQERGAGGRGRESTDLTSGHPPCSSSSRPPLHPVTVAGDNVASRGRWVRLWEIMAMGT